MGNIRLEPCPFCGSNNPLIQPGIIARCYSIYCRKCGAHVFFYGKEDKKLTTVSAWNNRKEKEHEQEA